MKELKLVATPNRPVNNAGKLATQPLLELRDILGDLVLTVGRCRLTSG